MILAIDVGNTSITIGCTDGADVPHVFRMSADITKTEDEYAAGIRSILGFHGAAQNEITGAVISSVVPPLTGVMKNAAKLLTGHEAIVVGAGVKTGVNITIDDPGQLGSDMVCAAVGALARYKPPLIIVDMGTATKLIVINKNGSFIGGAIMPGVTLSVNALSAGTSQLPRVSIEAPARCISANTIDCMRSGAVFGAASMIDGMAARVEEELGEQALVIATGGQSGAIYKHCKRGITYEPNLILQGLAAIYEKNKRK